MNKVDGTMRVARSGGLLVATRLFRRDLDKDFSSSLFGYLWNFADPLVIAGVFIVLRSGGIIGGEELMIPFGVYVLYGMLLLKAFTNALARPLTLLKRSASLLTQTQVSSLGLLGADVLRLLFDLAFYIPVLLVVSIVMDSFNPTGFLLFLVLLPCMTIAGLAFSVLLAPINTIYSDIQRFVSSIQRPLIFICPTFYRPERESLFGEVFDVYNPIAILMNNLRQLAVSNTWQDLPAFVIVMAVATVLLVGGVMFFVRAVPLVGASVTS